MQRLGLLLIVLSLVSSEAFSQYRRVHSGRPRSRAPVPNNMALVINQTQDSHRQIVDLLEQMRRMQDLQVTNEVRSLTLSDSFFERNGIDFDFDIGGNMPSGSAGSSAVIGVQGGPLGNTFQPTPNGAIQFRQGSFGSTAPTFGNYDPATPLTAGVSFKKGNNQAWLFGQFGQGSNRTQTMTAPKTTSFNGQSAFISDATQRPFVTSVIPVVGGRPQMLVPGWSQHPLLAPNPYFGVNPYYNFAPYRPVRRYSSPIVDILRRMKQEGRSLTVAQVTREPASRPAKTHRPAYQAPGQSFASRLDAARYSSAAQPAPSVAEIRRLRSTERKAGQDEAMLHYQRGLEAEAAGKPKVAKIYYRNASKTASGNLEKKILGRIQALNRLDY